MKKKGFTLIELLVVIAIIALLMAIIMPSLRLAKDHAKKIGCSANLRSLAAAALLYADENNGRTPSATNVCVGNTEAGWCGRTNDYSISGRPPYDTETQIYGNDTDRYTGLVNGQLWPYIETTDAWRCPADPEKEQLRSYAMGAQWWNKYYVKADRSVSWDTGGNPRARVYLKFTECKNTASQLLFVDQIGTNADAYFAIWYSQFEWWNIPNYRHNGGSVNGFADGHVEAYKMEANTVDLADESFNDPGQIAAGYKMLANDDPDCEDLKFYQRATWGKWGW